MREQPESAANVMSGVSESEVETLVLTRFDVASSILKTVQLAGRPQCSRKRGAGLGRARG